MKILHISDTHTYHYMLNIPKDIDMIIFSGDCSNPMNPSINEHEVRTFIDWYSKLDIKYKIFVAGNHDTSIEKGYVNKFDFQSKGIVYLENDFTEIEGLKIWGSPYTPTYGNWSFMKARDKIGRIWENIPLDSDIVVVHGPPKGILDSTYNRSGLMEFCGCKSLLTAIKLVNPKLMCFGHIHNMENIINFGTRTIGGQRTIFSNGSIIEDRHFDSGPYNQGNIIEL